METLWLDLKYAVRMFSRNPGFVFVSVVTLALGIGLNTAVFGVLNAVLFRSLPYHDPERLVHIDELGEGGGVGVSTPNFLDFRQQNRSLEQVAAFAGGSFVLTGSEEPLRVEGLNASHNLFALLGARPLVGRAFLPEEETPGRNQVAVMSHRLWTRRFSADLCVFGRNITLDGKVYEVVGVMPAEFDFSAQAAPVELWIPLAAAPNAANLRGAHYLDVVGRLRPGQTTIEARADLETIAQGIARDFPKFVTGRMKVVPLKEHWVGSHRSSLTLLAGAVALVLLIATANVASLLIARAAQRQKEDSVGATTNLPLSGTNMVFIAQVEGRPGFSSAASFRAVSPDYFRTMRIPLLRGRPLDGRDRKNTMAVIIINETMARNFFPGEEPLGKRIIHGFANQVAEVVGVVGDVKYAGLDQETKPEMYAPYLQNAWPFMRIVVRTKSDPLELATAVRRQVLAIDKDQPVDRITTMQAVLGSSFANRRFAMQLLSVFAVLALVLAIVGVYGIVSYYVVQRMHEIGVRVALGAQRRDVLQLVLRHGMLLVLLGVSFGLAGSYALARLLTTLLFGVGAVDPATFAAMALLMSAVALLAAYFPARRATRVDPIAVLRFE